MSVVASAKMEKLYEFHTSNGLAWPMPLVGAWVHLNPPKNQGIRIFSNDLEGFARFRLVSNSIFRSLTTGLK